MREMPLRPSSNAFQVCSAVSPIALRRPTPVTTTLREIIVVLYCGMAIAGCRVTAPPFHWMPEHVRGTRSFRVAGWLFLLTFDVRNGVSDRRDFLGVFVRNLP